MVRRSKIIFCDVGIHIIPNERIQKHLVRGKKGQWDSKEKGDYRAESEKGPCVKKNRQDY